MRSVAVFIGINISCDLLIYFIKDKKKKSKTFNTKSFLLSNLGVVIPLLMAHELDIMIENNSFFKLTQLLLIGFIGKEIVKKLDILGIPISKKIRNIIEKIYSSNDEL